MSPASNASKTSACSGSTPTPEKPLDLSGLTALEDAGMIWNAKFSGLSGCTSLRKLYVSRITRTAIHELRGLHKLRNLDLVHTQAQDFSAVWSLAGLQELRVGLAPHLTTDDLRGIAQLKDLRQLILQSCRHLTTLDQIAKCELLRKLVIEDCGPIDSIKPLAALHHLEELAVNGTTDVLDCDLGVVLQLPKLTSFAAARRKRYKPAVPDIENAIAARTQ